MTPGVVLTLAVAIEVLAAVVLDLHAGTLGGWPLVADSHDQRVPGRWELVVGEVFAIRSVQQSTHCAREEFLYELKAGQRAAACGGRPRPAGSMRR